jgi:peptidoglycan/xylan/chitin deacetylase (PgdA/CDA1 family)
VSKGKLEGEVLAYFSDGIEKFPAIVIVSGSVIFNFDPEETIHFLISERYHVNRRPLYTFLPFHYHRVPGNVRVLISRLFYFSKIHSYRSFYFPSWFIERSVELIRSVFLNTLSILEGNRINTLPFWPNSKDFSIVLTHDVDTNKGFRMISRFIEIEERYGLKSSWNFVSRHYDIDSELLDSLIKKGYEIASHGYNHDNKLPFLDKRVIEKRLLECLEFLSRYNVEGFRSPSLFTTKELYEILPKFFSYDSSIPDTELFRGSCSVFPFTIGNLVELPLTLPMDSTLIFYRIWMEKMDWIKRIGGLVVVTTHPEPHFSGNKKMLNIYERLISRITYEPKAWIDRPREIAKWWRERNSKNVG